jgi:hypothetical protein
LCNARCHALAGVSSSFDAAQREIARLRGAVRESAEQQARAADVLDEVSTAVHASGARLEALGLQSSDVVAALGRAEVRGEAMGRAMLATQVFLAQVQTPISALAAPAPAPASPRRLQSPKPRMAVALEVCW